VPSSWVCAPPLLRDVNPLPRRGTGLPASEPPAFPLPKLPACPPACPLTKLPACPPVCPLVKLPPFDCLARRAADIAASAPPAFPPPMPPGGPGPIAWAVDCLPRRGRALPASELALGPAMPLAWTVDCLTRREVSMAPPPAACTTEGRADTAPLAMEGRVERAVPGPELVLSPAPAIDRRLTGDIEARWALLILHDQTKSGSGSSHSMCFLLTPDVHFRVCPINDRLHPAKWL
jgi:hypothetical protein